MAKMAADPPDAAPPVTFAGGVLDRFRHVCAFVNDRAEQDAILDPFIRQGIAAGDQLLYLVDPAEAAAPVNHIRHLGYDVAAQLADRRLDVRTWSETYLRD